MAEPLKVFFSPALARDLAEDLRAAWPAFPAERFVALATERLDDLELLGRAAAFRDALTATLPGDYPTALDVLVRSLPPEERGVDRPTMAPFRYLPHVLFVAQHGLADFDASMSAQHVLTRRFTAEFSLRTFVAADPARALTWLERWIDDPSEHVRRLVSEGTRPRLPWAARLRLTDWRPIHALLARLVDDPSVYVRRSVANHVNDVYVDDPDVAIALCTTWARPDRATLLRHALRGAIKAGDPRALALVGTGAAPEVEVSAAFPPTAAIGSAIDFRVTIRSRIAMPQPLTVDLVVHFVKPSGRTGRKVFRVGRPTLVDTVTLKKRVSLRQHSTRTHVPGWHAVEVQVNGVVFAVGGFEVVG
jgi:3-methyladenine DNA glycosylase AlkC